MSSHSARTAQTSYTKFMLDYTTADASSVHNRANARPIRPLLAHVAGAPNGGFGHMHFCFRIAINYAFVASSTMPCA